MRVIGGSAKGRKLQAPRGHTTRPTPARVREALFSIIAAWVPDSRVLDLFAGSGALGIESLSRGAQSAVFVESDPQALKALRTNTSFVADSRRVLSMLVMPALSMLGGACEKFDIIFADPPYPANLWHQTLAMVVRHELLTADGIVVCEHPGSGQLVAPSGLSLWRTRRFGDVAVSIFTRE